MQHLDIKTLCYLLFTTIHDLTLIRVGFLEVCFESGRQNYPLHLKLVRINLETWNLVRKYNHILENISFSAKIPWIFYKKPAFFGISSTLIRSNSIRDVLKIF